MKTHITVDDIMNLYPCYHYTRGRVEELWAGRKSLTPLSIANLDIPEEDRIWALLRADVLSEKALHELACDFAESVLHLFEEKYPDDKRPRTAIETKRRWLRGEASDKELKAVYDSAHAAVSTYPCAHSDYSSYSAYSAYSAISIYNNDYITASDTAVHAAAAYAVASSDATASDATVPERKKQLKMIVKKLKQNNKRKEKKEGNK